MYFDLDTCSNDDGEWHTGLNLSHGPGSRSPVSKDACTAPAVVSLPFLGAIGFRTQLGIWSCRIESMLYHAAHGSATGLRRESIYITCRLQRAPSPRCDIGSAV